MFFPHTFLSYVIVIFKKTNSVKHMGIKIIKISMIIKKMFSRILCKKEKKLRADIFVTHFFSLKNI